MKSVFLCVWTQKRIHEFDKNMKSKAANDYKQLSHAK